MPRSSPLGWVRWSLVLGVAVVAAQGVSAAERVQEIYVVRGEHGEISFSDESRSGAERIAVTVREPSPEAVLAAERRVEQTLRVAKVLEDSRLARERERAQQRGRAPLAPPAVIAAPMDPYLAYLIGRPVYPHVSPRHRQRGQEPADPPPAEPVLYSPMMPRGAAWRAEDGSSWLRPAAEG
jgi:hypothetical protein